MKTLVSFVLVLAVSSAASASVGTVIEDFESYTVGDILGSSNGWSAGTGAEVIMGADGTKSIRDDATAYFSGERTAGFTPLGAGYTGPAHMAMTVVPKMPGGDVVYHGFRTKAGLGGWSGPAIGFTDGAADSTPYDGKGRFFLHTNDYAGAWYLSTDVCYVDHVYDLVLNMDIVNHQYDAYGTLYYRDVTVGGNWIKTSIDHVSLNSNVVVGPYNVDHFSVNGGFDGQMDNLAWGPGHVTVPEPFTIALLGLGGLLLRKRH
jgi:hypothetical protein